MKKYENCVNYSSWCEQFCKDCSDCGAYKVKRSRRH